MWATPFQGVVYDVDEAVFRLLRRGRKKSRVWGESCKPFVEPSKTGAEWKRKTMALFPYSYRLT